MTAKLRNLSVLSYANGFTHYTYVSRDTPLADLLQEGYFSAFSDMLATGDVIMLVGSDGNAQRYVRSDGTLGELT
jgi:hypothetical protein